MGITLGHIGTAALCWIALVIKGFDLTRDPSNRGRQIMCAVFLGLAIAVTTGLTPVYAAIDHLSHFPNLAKLVQHTATVTACGAIDSLFVYLTSDGTTSTGTTRRRILAAATIATMVVLFALAPVDVSEPIYFADRYSTAPFIPAYMCVFTAFIGWTCAHIAVTAWRYARRGGSGDLGRSLRLFALSSVTGVLYCVFKVLYIVGRELDAEPPVREGAISSPLALVTIVLAIAGLILPKAANAFGSVRDWTSNRRAYRRLYPLWADLYRARPEIALDRPVKRDGLVFRDIGYRLYRRAVEIQDGILALRSCYSPDVTGAAETAAKVGGLDRNQVSAAAQAEAAAIARAIAGGDLWDNDNTAVDSYRAMPSPTEVGSGIQWLAMVADAYKLVKRERSGYEQGGERLVVALDDD